MSSNLDLLVTEICGKMLLLIYTVYVRRFFHFVTNMLPVMQPIPKFTGLCRLPFGISNSYISPHM
jgi:hypothetical protein